VLHQIGIGTLGPVFRTYEPTRDRLVAVKVFRLDIVPEQAHALAAALARAVQSALFHPSIVEPIDAGVEGTLAYRAEEYVAAESLDVAMRHYAPAPPEKVLPFITQLAGAIDFARAAGIGHGGLHPRDIFVTPDDARATGFGVVEALEQVGIRAPIRRPYSAPERIAGSAWGTPADVFSLAAITFELLTARRPAGTGAQIGALPEGDHAAALHAVLARAMDDEPERRYASALAFAGALEAASQGRPLTDAVSQVVAIAGPSSSVPRAEPAASTAGAGADTNLDSSLPLVLDVPAVASNPEAQMDVHEPAPPTIAEPELVEHSPAVSQVAPGEFEIEAELDPMHRALDDVALREAAPIEPSLFDDADERIDEERDARFRREAGEDDVHEADGHERFVDDFVEEQHAEADMRSPLEEEAPPPVRVAALAEPTMMDVGEDVIDPADRGRPAILPLALVAMAALLVGFAGGYFVGSRERLVPAQEVAQEAGPAASQPGPQTYSEQKVTQPAPAPPPTATAAPARSATSAAPSPSAAVPAPTPAPRETRREPVAQKGQIVVRSLPSHAGVTLNNTWRGRTPLTLGDLPFGSYVVRVVQPGYAVAREEVTLTARAPSHTVTTRLERTAKAAPAPPVPTPDASPAAFTGSLYVDSRPRGASVTIDGRAVGQTPISVPDVRAGTHVVRIEMDGKKPVSASPRIVAGKMERITVSLEDKQ
jgi:serine/threonine protein kinase